MVTGLRSTAPLPCTAGAYCTNAETGYGFCTILLTFEKNMMSTYEQGYRDALAKVRELVEQRLAADPDEEGYRELIALRIDLGLLATSPLIFPEKPAI